MRAAGFDVEWAGSWPSDPGDDEILTRSIAEMRILITLDKDFGELAVRRRVAHCGIMRLVGFAARRIAPTCIQVLRRYEADFTVGCLVTVDQNRVRIRRPA
jgi:predicted nuclease of predicted toxin-antitoxin system